MEFGYSLLLFFSFHIPTAYGLGFSQTLVFSSEVSDSSGKALNIALKKRHAKVANKLMLLYKKIGEIRAVVDSVFLEGGDE